jgi:hypothetical protein
MNTENEPAEEVVEAVLTKFVSRLRFVTWAPFVRVPPPDARSWAMSFLKDDGVTLELPRLRGQFRAFGNFSQRIALLEVVGRLVAQC